MFKLNGAENRCSLMGWQRDLARIRVRTAKLVDLDTLLSAVVTASTISSRYGAGSKDRLRLLVGWVKNIGCRDGGQVEDRDD